MQINNNQNNVNFKSVIPVRVVIDGRYSFGAENIKHVIQAFQKVVTKSEHSDSDFKFVRDEFIRQVPDFESCDRGLDSGEVIRNYIDGEWGSTFIFTGEHVKKIHTEAKKIGPAKAGGKADSFEAKKLAKDYFILINNLIKNATARLRQNETNNPVELYIYAKSGKKPQEFKIEDISFEKIGVPPKDLTKHSRQRGFIF